MQLFTSICKKGCCLSLIILFLLLNGNELKAEGTPSLAPDPADAAALYIGAGNTGGLGGDYGQFAWQGSSSRLYFNIQNLNEKAYLGFSLPWNNREFQNPNPYSNASGVATNLEFRILAPDGTHLTCFGNAAGWQPLTSGNISTRAETVTGPATIGGTGGYTPFVFDPSTCGGLTQTGDYFIEFRSTDPSYDPNTNTAGFYIEYFDITVADAGNAPIDGRVWSNNWGIGIKSDGDGPFDRAFNGAFHVCSTEGFVTSINFNTNNNTRAEAGKNNDQRSGFRAGSFNVSFNTSGPQSSGNIVGDRQSLMNANAANPQLRVFLNPPSEDICKPQEIGEFGAASNLLTGCPNDRCVNMTATQPGQVELLIEQTGGNGIFDAPSDRILAYLVTAADLVSNPQSPGHVYEFCIPWDGKDGAGNFLAAGDFIIEGFYSQGIYHFPVYDAEFNDDGFEVETINPPSGIQKVYYDDSNISETNGIAGEPKIGADGCTSSCHRWTGEWEDFVFGSTNNSDDIYGNFNTINTWWFAVTQTDDLTGGLNNQSFVNISCPADVTLCAGSSIAPADLGSATSSDASADCTVKIEYGDATVNGQGCSKVITRTWKAYIEGIPDTTTCTQIITIEDTAPPTISGIPGGTVVECDAIPAVATGFTVSDNCDNTLTTSNIVFNESIIAGTCPNAYTIRRTWKLNDACGNSNEYQQLITVRDKIEPTINGVPVNITANCNNIPAAPTNITATDNCGGTVTLDFSEENIAGSCDLRRTWTAVDACGNITIETQTITLIDTKRPKWMNFENTVVTECDDVPDTTPNATDECSAVTVTLLNEERVDGDCPDSYDLIRTWEARDACGNARTKNQTVKVRDRTRPEWVDFPKVECIECSATPPNETPKAIDNCDNDVEVTLVKDSTVVGTCAGEYEIFRIWKATDNCGNSRTKNQRITVKDRTKPDWDNFPTNIAADCDNIPANTTPTAIDNCSAITITMLAEVKEGTCGNNHKLIRTWQASDDCGNTRTRKQTIRLRDNTRPSWTDFPKAVTVDCDAIPAQSAPLATDNCDTDVTVTLLGTEQVDQTCDNSYTLLREWQAADECGNVRTRKQYIYVRDYQKPAWVDFPAAQVMQCGQSPAMIAPQAIDNCGNAVVVELMEQTEEPGDCAGKYTMFRKWKATDACGNSITKRQRYNYKDGTKPAWDYFPANRTEYCEPSTGGGAPGPSANLMEQDTPTSTDNCDDNVQVNLIETTRVDGNCPGNYKLRHKWRSTDACGNTITKTQVVTHKDTLAPTWLNFPKTITVECDAVPAQSAPAAGDACSTVTVELLSETIDEDVVCPIAYRIVRRWRATDECGNRTAKNEIIKVRDRTAPVLTKVAENIELECGSSNAQANLETWIANNGGAIASDNCGDLEWFHECPKFDFECGESVTAEFYAIDRCGNRVQTSATITVVDTQAPTWTSAPNSLNQSVPCGTDLSTIVPPVATDNCGSVTVSVVTEQVIPSAQSNSSAVTVKWVAVDACGNESSTFVANINIIIPTQPSTACFESATFNSSTCQWEVSGTQTSPPSTACYETATFNTGSCTWVVTGTQPAQPSTACYETASFNTGSCTWVITGTQPTQPSTTCYETASFNTSSCTWVVTGTQPTVPATACYQTASFNTGSCTWVITGTQPTQPSTNCYEQATFNTGSCSWVVTGTQPTQPSTNCYEQATFNTGSCSWVVTGTQPTQPAIACYEQISFNTSSCTWVVTGTQPTAPSTACYENASFNTNTCQWEVSGTQPQQPSLSCNETASWNASTCQWVITGSSPGSPSISCPADYTACPSSAPATTSDAIASGGVDNCSLIVDFNDQVTSESCAGASVTQRTWIAYYPGYQNQAATCVQTITLEDREAPVLFNVPANMQISCSESIPGAAQPTVTDNCASNLPIEYTEERVDGDCAGSYTIKRTWKVADNCGNAVMGQQTITVVDDVKPDWGDFKWNSTYDCGTTPTAAQPTATDNCGSAVTVWMLDETTEAGDCSEPTIVRRWRARDACDNTRTRKQYIRQKDNKNPLLRRVASNLRLNCNGTNANMQTRLQNWLDTRGGASATDNCGNLTWTHDLPTVAFNCSNAYQVTFTATDGCGNQVSTTANLTILDNAGPTLVGVPTNATVSCDAIPTAPTVTATDNCDPNVSVQFNEVSSGNFCAGGNITRTWTATDVCGNTSTKTQVIKLVDNTPPSMTCPADVQLQSSGGCGGSSRLNITLPTGTDNCGGAVSVTSSVDLNADFAAGTTVVTLTAADACNNQTTCNFNVVVAGGDSGLTSQACPSNMVIDCDAVAGQSIATWEPPSGDACCSSCSSQTAITGYVFMGERGGHRYYCSDGKANWDQAMAAAASMGGYLAVINDPAENAFLAGQLQNQKAYIGLSDAGSEGNFYWTNGETASYRNWVQMQPNNKNNSQHYGQLLPDGTWNDTYKTDMLEYIIEIPCIDVRQTSGPLNGASFPVGVSTVTYAMTDNCGKTETCSFSVTVNPAIQLHVEEDVTFDCKEGTNGYTLGWAVPSASSCCDDCPPVGQNIDGFLYMGRLNGHQYYCSMGKATYNQATAIANSLNGYLAVVNTAPENAMLTNFLAGQSAYIGLSDKAQEGTYRWQNGDPLSYSNWSPGQPNNKNGQQDFVHILSDGTWDDIYDNLPLEFIVEIPCLSVEQTGGLTPGSFFGPGTHTITYQAVDNCGNMAEESFDITVNACAVAPPPVVCTAAARYDNYFWIKNVRLGTISNPTGRDGGYKDFTNLSTSMSKGSSQMMSVAPGFANSAYWMYWRVYIDYNQDGDFNDAGEVVFQYKHYQPLQINFKVPTNCKTGQTTMRVVMSYGGYAGGCQSYTYGEIEDYTVNITSPASVRETAESRNEEVVVEVLESSIAPPTGVSLESALAAGNQPTLNAYPNPVNSNLTVELQHITTENAKLSIFNSVGQRIHIQALDQEAQQRVLLDVSDYKDGIYLLSIDGDDLKPLLQKFTKF